MLLPRSAQNSTNWMIWLCFAFGICMCVDSKLIYFFLSFIFWKLTMVHCTTGKLLISKKNAVWFVIYSQGGQNHSYKPIRGRECMCTVFDVRFCTIGPATLPIRGTKDAENWFDRIKSLHVLSLRAPNKEKYARQSRHCFAFFFPFGIVDSVL